MKQLIGFSQFCDAFWDTYKGNFTYDGKRALFDYLENIENETGEEIELDIVTLCCEYSEYSNAIGAAKEYGYQEVVDLEPHGSVDLIEVSELEEKQALRWLKERTEVISVDGGGVIIQQF